MNLEHLASEFEPYYRPLIYTAAYTGARWQDLTGLLRANLDLGRAKLHVRTVVARVAPTSSKSQECFRQTDDRSQPLIGWDAAVSHRRRC